MSTPGSIDLAAVVSRLAERLHAVGVEAGPDRAGRFAASLRLARPVSTRELYWLGRVTLTATPAVERTLNGDPERLKRTLEKYIVRRPGRPDDVANMVQFLASNASPWITGQVYPVNGGFTFAL